MQTEAEVDAVQTHNGGEAIKSAWGVDVTASDDESSASSRGGENMIDEKTVFPETK